MTNEAEYYTYEAFDVDYTEQLDRLIANQEDLEMQLAELIEQGEAAQTELEALTAASAANLPYLPHIHQSTALILGTMIVYILFRLVVSFLSRIFSDTSTY